MKRRTMIASAVSALVAQIAQATAPAVGILAVGTCFEEKALESASSYMAKTFEDAFFMAYGAPSRVSQIPAQH